MSPVRLVPETLMFCVVELVPKLAAKLDKASGLTLTTGPLIVPESDTLRVSGVPAAATTSGPERAPLCSEEAKRTHIVALFKTPASLGVSVSGLGVKLLPSVECSKPGVDGKAKATVPGSPVPLTVKVRAAEAVKSALLKAGKEAALTVRTGATTDPLTATVRVRGVVFNAPGVLTVTLPERETAVDEAAKRTAMLWLRLPLCGTRLRALGAKLLPSADNSKPSGAVTVTLPRKPAPLTAKKRGSEGVPKRVERVAKVAGAAVRFGDTLKVVVTSGAGL